MIRRTRIDEPFATQHYGMKILPYAGVYIGFLEAYHGQTNEAIPAGKLWMDKADTQLTFSRNGLTWTRTGPRGAIPHDWEPRLSCRPGAATFLSPVGGGDFLVADQERRLSGADPRRG